MFGTRGAAIACAAVVTLATVVPVRGQRSPSVEPGSADDLSALIGGYNAALERATGSVDSLRVTQEMTEPQEDGSARTATAELLYTRGSDMERRVIFSDLSYPAGEYTLASLLGPPLLREDYEMRLAGEEEAGGVPCLRISVVAKRRDAAHFDGDVWISKTAGLVRIRGAVADPPFPLAEIRLDKSFSPGPLGFPVLRRHVGEVRVGRLLGGQKGARTILYTGYSVNGNTEG